MFFRDSEVVVLCSSRSILIRNCVKVTPDLVSLSSEVRYTLTGAACCYMQEKAIYCDRRSLVDILSMCSSSTVEIEKIN